MFTEQQFQRITEEILVNHRFEFPITWTMIGINGYVFAGKWEVTILKKFNNVILHGQPKRLRFPINMMLVDRTGKAAHVLFKKSDAPIDLTRLQIGEA
jgi:hypothetical protein